MRSGSCLAILIGIDARLEENAKEARKTYLKVVPSIEVIKRLWIVLAAAMEPKTHAVLPNTYGMRHNNKASI